MTSSWRERGKKRLKKPTEKFFGFADEETTFAAIEPSPPVQEANIEPVADLTRDKEALAVEYRTQESKLGSPEAFRIGNDDTAISNPAIPRKKTGVSSPLARQKTGVSSLLARQKTGVSSHRIPSNAGTPSALDTPLGRRKLGVRLGVSSPLDIEELVGDERALVIYVANECRKNASLETGWINSEELVSLYSVDANELRNLIFRVKKKGFFEVESRQHGRVGLRKFFLDKSLYQQALALVSQKPGVSSPLGQALGTALDEAPISIISSSSEFKRENTNTGQFELSDEDLASLKKIGFQEGHRAQIEEICTRGTLAKPQIEDSLVDYAFDAEAGVVTSVLLLFKELRAGRPYHSARRSKQLAQELKELQTKISEAKKIEADLAAAKLEEEYAIWLTHLSEEERRTILSSYPKSIATDKALRMAFEAKAGVQATPPW